ncbi:MAG: 5'/3'-nucleotidase SurE [Proteobacteria bacterium]|jgi:5'-nucleotidase|nr:5'/3'-nucleotidase SurE [Pseudomonadota bacterium]
MKILISNDDGIFSKGIDVLEKAMSKYGETIVVAPATDQSGMSHALTLNRPLRIEKVSKNRYTVDGTPADCVHFGLQDLFPDKKPDLLISGINHGANLGEDVWYSGTVGAAIEGSLMGVRSIAVSLVPYQTADLHFEPVTHFLENDLSKLLEHGSKNSDIIYNINVPSVAADKVEKIEFTKLGARRYKSTLVRNLDPRGKVYFWIGGEKIDFDKVEGTDSNAIRREAISISPIHLNITDMNHLESMKKWAF